MTIKRRKIWWLVGVLLPLIALDALIYLTKSRLLVWQSVGQAVPTYITDASGGMQTVLRERLVCHYASWRRIETTSMWVLPETSATARQCPWIVRLPLHQHVL